MVSLITLSACSNNSNKPNVSNEINNASAKSGDTSATDNHTKTASINRIISSYLQMKNAFTNDNGKDDAAAGNLMKGAFKSFEIGRASCRERVLVQV